MLLRCWCHCALLLWQLPFAFAGMNLHSSCLLPCRSTVNECYWTGLRQMRWARAAYAANLGECGDEQAGKRKQAAECLRRCSLAACYVTATCPPAAGFLHYPIAAVIRCCTDIPIAGREYVMPVRDIGRHGYKSDIKALCECRWQLCPQSQPHGSHTAAPAQALVNCRHLSFRPVAPTAFFAQPSLICANLAFAAGWMYFLMGMIFGCGIGEVINLCGELQPDMCAYMLLLLLLCGQLLVRLHPLSKLVAGCRTLQALVRSSTLGPGTRATRGSGCGGEWRQAVQCTCRRCCAHFPAFCCLPQAGIQITVRHCCIIYHALTCRRYNLPPMCCMPPGIDDCLVS